MKKLLFLLLSFCCMTVWGQNAELIRKAEAGDAEAQGWLAFNYKFGLGGFEKNDHKAAKWAKLGAEAGDAQAQDLLASLYKYGRGGLSQNEELAFKWAHKAAAQGNSPAMYSLGSWYEDTNKQEAIYWFKKYMDAYYQECGKEDEKTAKKLRKLGVEYHPKKSSNTASSSSSSSGSSSSSSGRSTPSVGHKLLYSGTYTISNRAQSRNTGQYTEAWGPDQVCKIEVYEDELVIHTDNDLTYTFDKDSGNPRAYYSTMSGEGVIYVNPVTFTMRKEVTNSFSFGGFTSTDTFVYAITKGETTYNYNNPGAYGNNGGGYVGNGGGNPVHQGGDDNKPKTYESYCLRCGGSGKCATCNGTHSYINPLSGKYVTCPNCGTDGRFRSCGGSGKKTKIIR